MAATGAWGVDCFGGFLGQSFFVLDDHEISPEGLLRAACIAIAILPQMVAASDVSFLSYFWYIVNQ